MAGRRNKGPATKDIVLRVMVDEDLKKKISEHAEAAGLSLSAWMRTTAAAAVGVKS